MMRLLKFVLLSVVIVVGLAGGMLYKKPLWMADQVLLYKLKQANVRSHFVNIPEGRIHYIDGPVDDNGGAVPLVLIHGLAGRSLDYTPLIPMFEENNFHVYALDLLGYGGSDKPVSSDYSIATEEQVVLHFMDAMHLKHAYVVGWSMGGWIALKLALDAPQRVDRIAVLDSAGITFVSDLDAAAMAPTDGAGVDRLIRTMSPTMRVPPPFIQRDIIRWLGEQRWVVERSLNAMRGGKDIVDFKLASMQPPLVIVHGSQDALIPPSVAESMHRMDPRSVYVSVLGCGHFAPMECSEAVGKATVAFLKAQPAMVGGELTVRR